MGSIERLHFTAINSTISGNGSGGIYSFEAGGVTLINTTVSGNEQSGVTIDRSAGLTMTNSTVSGNGGVGISNIYSTVTVTNSTLSGNSLGGIRTYRGSTTSVNNTISGNSSSRAGGGVYNTLESQLTLTRTLISGNTAPNGSELFNRIDNSTVTADNFNLFGHSDVTNEQALVGFTPGGTDINATSNGNRPTALSAVLNTNLASNGGPTRTHTLVAGSPAVDAVTNVDTCPPPATDQRGVVRPRGQQRRRRFSLRYRLV